MKQFREGQLDELRVLIAEVREGQPTAAHGARLRQLLDENAAARRMYARYGSMQALLEMAVAGMDAQRPDDIPPELAGGWLPSTIEEAEGREPPPVLPVLGFLGNAYHGTIGFFSQEIPFSLLIATVITGLGLLAGSMVYVNQPNPIAKKTGPARQRIVESHRERVGQITGMVDCKWVGFRGQGAGKDNSPSLVALGDRFTLASGLMEITYDTGARVILQGPVTYEVDSRDGGFLSVGKLTARLEKREEVGSQQNTESNRNEPQPALTLALSQRERGPDNYHQSLIPKPSPLFTIKTPTATVTDLGTEFGVEVDKAGNTTSHVFQGSVRVQMVSALGKAQGDARVLCENESARVEIGKGKPESSLRVMVLTKSVKPVDFVRKIPRPTIKYLDLVDVVAGGDGFSGRRNRGIDPASGTMTDKPPQDYHINSDGQYHRVAGQPLVDGVFIPNAQEPVQVDSAGHTFSGFAVSASMTFGYIWAGGQVPTNCHPPVQTKLGEIDYALPGHGLIFLHADKGITFDLEAIRRANPKCSLKRFLATTGNTEVASQGVLGPLTKEISQTVYADVWVLVDGQMRFRRREINGYSGAFPVDVSIGKNDRFLTLVGSDGGNHIHADWILFGDPRIELLSIPSDSTK